MKNKYFILLAAGSRVKGKPQFGSEAEKAHFNLSVKTLQTELGPKLDKFMSNLGCFTAYLTEDEYINLLQDSRILDIQLVGPKIPLPTVQTDASWALSDITGEFSTTFTYTLTGVGVSVYVVDSGVYAAHPDFSGRVVTLYDATGGATATQSPNPDTWHGTGSAGVIGGEICGVAKDCIMYDVRVGTEDGSYADIVVDGLDFILGHHVPGTPAVASLSVGGYDPELYPYEAGIENMAVAALLTDGIHCVAAAHNFSRDSRKDTVASDERLIVVGASTPEHTAATFTNYGPRVDIFAPGIDVPRPEVGANTFTTENGTSIACPLVAGVIAAYLEANPTIAPAEMKSFIKAKGLPIINHDLPETTNKLVNTNLPSLPLRLTLSKKSTLSATPVIVSIDCNRAADIRYTLDGSEPKENSLIYSAPLEINQTCQLRAKAFASSFLPVQKSANFVITETLLQPNSFNLVSAYCCSKQLINLTALFETTSCKPVELLPIDGGTKIFYTESLNGDLVVNEEIVNQFYKDGLVALPTALTVDDTAYVIPSESIRVFTCEVGEPILEVSLTGYKLPAYVCSKHILKEQLGYVTLSTDGIIFSPFIKLTQLDQTIKLKLPKIDYVVPGTKVDLALAIVTIN